MAEAGKLKNTWSLTGVEFHRKWREGKTICDSAQIQQHVIVHHGFFSLEWRTFENIAAWNKARTALHPKGGE